MQVIEKEITKNQIVYELTQEELNNIKKIRIPEKKILTF